MQRKNIEETLNNLKSNLQDPIVKKLLEESEMPKELTAMLDQLNGTISTQDRLSEDSMEIVVTANKLVYITGYIQGKKNALQEQLKEQLKEQKQLHEDIGFTSKVVDWFAGSNNNKNTSNDSKEKK